MAVLDATGGAQTPRHTSSLTGDFSYAMASSDEEDLWASVRVSRDPIQIKLFLKAYPDTLHRDEAQVLLEAVMPVVPVGQAEPGVVPAGMAAANAGSDVTFAGPIKQGTVEIVGNTIEALIQTGPVFSPIPGLTGEAWMGKGCADCHQWTQAALCDQGKVHVGRGDEAVLETQHPLGGAFTLNLKRWAELGCD